MGYRLIPKGADRFAGIEASAAGKEDARSNPPPRGARTFADHGIAEARAIAARRPDVIIREDPMFGRRGYAKEVLPDADHGYLVLVIAYTVKPDRLGNWVEPFRPRASERQYWPPGKVEFVR